MRNKWRWRIERAVQAWLDAFFGPDAVVVGLAEQNEKLRAQLYALGYRPVTDEYLEGKAT
jgi:hypothetical protein